ncbi:multicomponent Na+:H+ antiporter subunit D [Terrimicrobium sacchariphilum]|uniref:Multicomponent Na+:H+ antiporter subunit D n=1 Tax=Terrimicrobium sacchariphilum TaxID=690879 RepID=A0A146G7D2_TERSA|nr:proton-conducting transporter membrane subunit [Terrimicrobium sacchariphilum]GAT33629.1 multicomponent Na+:H+ antiporter subunit D [Terrimicrobium sacchariphilum]
MNNLLVLPFLLPVLTAVICCLFVGRPGVGRRVFIAISAVVQCALAFYLAIRAFHGPPLVLLMGGWAPPLGVVLVVDGLAAIMLCLSTVVALACILFSYAEIPVWAEQPLRLPLMQLLVAGINLSFLTGDLFNLFVAFEIMLVASYALLTLEANDRHIKEAFPYLAVNMFGSALFLVAAGLAYSVFGTLNLADISRRAEAMQGDFGVMVVAVLLVVVFGIKAGVFPLYYWLPNSYPILPFSLGAFYSGMLTKVGIYVLLRTFGTVFPHNLTPLYTALAWLAGLTMVLAVLGAVSRNFIRGILSFHIVSQIGYMILAIGFFTPLAIAACIFYVIHHIIVKSSLFLIGGTAMFYNRTDNLARMGGLLKASPILATCFLLQAFSLAGVPPLSGFWGKYAIILVGLEEHRYWLVVAALVASVLTLVSMLKIWMGAFWQKLPVDGTAAPEAPAAARAMTAIVCALTLISVAIGFGAEFFFGIAQTAATSLLDPSQYREAVFSLTGKGGQ